MIKIETGVMCQSVFASADGYDWTLSIRKVGGGDVGEIAQWHEQEVSESYLREMLPGWEDANWRRLQPGKPLPNELTTVVGDYQLNIILPDECSRTDDEILNEFAECMRR